MQIDLSKYPSILCNLPRCFRKRAWPGMMSVVDNVRYVDHDSETLASLCIFMMSRSSIYGAYMWLIFAWYNLTFIRLCCIPLEICRNSRTHSKNDKMSHQVWFQLTANVHDRSIAVQRCGSSAQLGQCIQCRRPRSATFCVPFLNQKAGRAQ